MANGFLQGLARSGGAIQLGRGLGNDYQNQQAQDQYSQLSQQLLNQNQGNLAGLSPQAIAQQRLQQQLALAPQIAKLAATGTQGRSLAQQLAVGFDNQYDPSTEANSIIQSIQVKLQQGDNAGAEQLFQSGMQLSSPQTQQILAQANENNFGASVSALSSILGGEESATQAIRNQGNIFSTNENIRQDEAATLNNLFEEQQKKAAEGEPTAKLSDVSGLRKEYVAQAKVFTDVRDAFSRVNATSSPPTPSGDMALIFNYMKMLDPGSVVRESEFALAARTGALPDRVAAAYNKASNGQTLSSNIRNDFLTQAKNLFEAQERQFNQTTGEYGRIADLSGIDRDQILVDLSKAEPSDNEQSLINAREAIAAGKDRATIIQMLIDAGISAEGL